MPASLLIAGWICQACRRARLPQPSLKLGRGRHSVPFRNLTIQSVSKSESELRRTRNIGIIAHIDAGKTTTTERMLYYSGFTRTIGDVDDGSTVTDFLPAERARGITIQSAAVTFHWPPIQQGQSQKEESTSPINESELPRSTFSHVINLIDTPGHADFTFEVLRSVRILDGAVCILDGVAGVEAQTEKVWHQASAYMIPRIVYVNKLDRDGAAFGKTVKEIGSRLHGWPALCQIPWWEHGTGKFIGVGDVINLRGLRWKEGEDGKDIEVFTIPQLDKVDSNLSAEIRKARASLVEILSEFDEKMVEMYLEYDEDHLAIPSSAITESLRRCIMNGSGEVIPVFAGASFRNVGVQPLLDAVVDLLPDPSERPDPEITAGSTSGGLNDLLSGKLILEQQKSDRQRGKKAVSPVKAATPSVSNIEACALAFKVVNDPRRGVLVYVRVYSGALNRNALVFNTNLQVSERAPRLLKMYASEAMEITSIPAGHIGVIAGLKHARTGDTLISYMSQNPKTGPPAPLNSLQLRPIDVPPPVFFASLEAHSLSEEKHLSDTLALMLREDPSLHLSVDHESGQTLLSGMGELHLEIAKDRLINDFKAKASMGRIEIGYRECIVAESQPQFFLFENEISGKKGKASCTATVGPLNSHEFDATLENNPAAVAADGNIISINISRAEVESGSSESQVLPTHLSEHMVNQALINGALAALSRGPGYSFPIHSAHVSLSLSLRSDLFGSDSSPAAITSAARGAVSSALHSAAQANETSGGSGTALMEPVMNVTISVDEASLGNVVHDISSARGGQVISLHSDVEGQSEQLKAVDDRPAIDVMKIYAPPDPFGSTDLRDSSLSTGPARPRTVHARVPLKEMVGYLKHLRSMTGGRGTFVMSIDRFEKMSGMRGKVALQELRGDM